MPPAPRAKPPPEEIVRRAQAGDAQAQRLLFEEYGPRLRARILRRLPALVRRKVSASDVIQEAWLTAFQRLETFEHRGEGTFEAWLSKIVENKVRDEVRRFLRTGKRDARREGPDAETLGVRARARTPSSIVADAEAAEALAQRLRSLPPRSRRVVELVHREELSWAEVGERLDCTPEAARKLYSRVIERLGDEPPRPRSNGARRA